VAETETQQPAQPAETQPTTTSTSTNGTADDGKHEPSDSERRLEAALTAERRGREALQRQLDDLKKQAMSEQERAVAEAHEAGKAEARAELSTAMLRAEIRARAAGKLSDPADAVRLLDVDELLHDDGTFDHKQIDAALDELLKSKPYLAAQSNGSPPPPRPPQGVREQPAEHGSTAADDYLRGLIRKG
jgi:hypothetical protein